MIGKRECSGCSEKYPFDEVTDFEGDLVLCASCALCQTCGNPLPDSMVHYLVEHKYGFYAFCSGQCMDK